MSTTTPKNPSWLTTFENVVVVSILLRLLSLGLDYLRWFVGAIDDAKPAKIQQRSLFPGITKVDIREVSDDVSDAKGARDSKDFKDSKDSKDVSKDVAATAPRAINQTTPEESPESVEAAPAKESLSYLSDSTDNDSEYDSELEYFQKSIAIPCSTGLTTRLLPFKNDNGEIEWAFTEDIASKDMFGMYVQPQHHHQHHSMQSHLGVQDNTLHGLSPTVSNSSNNESIISAHTKPQNGNEEEEDEEDDDEMAGASPLTSHSSPFTPGDDSKKLSLGDLDDGLDGEKMHQCPHCDASFKIRGYLTRHLKKHAVKKAYSCPFHEFSVYIDENNIKHKCHPSGGFSRRDTYKTHLKSRHFKYPKGTKTKERSCTSGLCSMCGESFPNAEIWCELHVEGGECNYLPSGFKGKSRIKNRLKKQLSKQQQRELEQSGALFSKQFTMAAAVAAAQSAQISGQSPSQSSSQSAGALPSSSGSEVHSQITQPVQIPQVQSNQQSQSLSEDCASPFSNPPSGSYEYHTHTHNPLSASPSGSISAVNTGAIPAVAMSSSNSMYNNRMFIPKRAGSFSKEEYDDEFCLDIDQLNNATFNNFNEIINMMKFESQGFYQGPVQEPQQQQQAQPEQQTHTQPQQSPQQPIYASQYHSDSQYGGQFVNQLAIYN